MTQNIKILGLYVALMLLALLYQFYNANAKDFGVVGQTFEIEEVDMLYYIKTRLGEMERMGILAHKQAEMQQRLGEYVNTPTPVKELSHATQSRSWIFDPTYILNEDIKDQDGNIIHKKGSVVNPLDSVGLPEHLLFIDGDDKSQVTWALSYSKALISKIILVRGSPHELMKRHKVRIFFDQKGLLSQRFGIKQTPALVQQKGNKLLVEEIILKGN